MTCADCGERPATVACTEVRDGVLREFRLCEDCARKRGAGAGLRSFAGPLVNILMGLLEDSLSPDGNSEGCCPHCGVTYSDFRATGRLGCAACYETFARELRPLLRRVHGSPTHVAGRAHRGPAPGGPASEVPRLRAQLERAVRREDFERAAELRDEIRSMEGERPVEDSVADRPPRPAAERESVRRAGEVREGTGDVDD